MGVRTLKNSSTISLDVFFWEVLYRWKVAVVFMLVFGLGTMGFVHIKEKRAESAALAEQVALDMEAEEAEAELEAELKVPLTEAERLAVDSLIIQAGQIQELEDYFDKSPYMNQDPENMRTLFLDYHIEAPSSYAGDIAEELARFMEESFGKELSQIMDTDVSYVGELYTISGGQSFYSDSRNVSRGAVSLEVVLCDGMDASKIEGMASRLLKDGERKLPGSLGGYSISRSSISERTYADREYAAKQVQAQLDIVTKRINLAKAVDALTKAQKLKYYELSGEVPPVGWDQDKVAEEVVVEQATGGVVKTSKGRNFALGCLLGLFLFMLLLLFKLAFMPKVTDGMLVSEVYDIPSCGQYRAFPYKGLGAFVHSRLVYNKKYGADPAQALSEIKRYIEYYRANNEDGASFVCAAPLNGTASNIVASFGGEITVLSGTKAERLDMISKSQGILVVPVTVSYKYFDELMEDFARAGVKPSGVILVEA